MEASPSVLSEAEDVDIVLRVKEAPKYFLRTATDIGDGEGSAVSSGFLRRELGRVKDTDESLSLFNRLVRRG